MSPAALTKYSNAQASSLAQFIDETPNAVGKASAELTAEEEDTEPPSVAGKDLKEEPAAGPQETPAPEPATVPEPAAGPEHEREGASAEDGEKDDTPKKKPPKTKF